MNRAGGRVRELSGYPSYPLARGARQMQPSLFDNPQESRRHQSSGDSEIGNTRFARIYSSVLSMVPVPYRYALEELGHPQERESIARRCLVTALYRLHIPRELHASCIARMLSSRKILTPYSVEFLRVVYAPKPFQQLPDILC